jgi:hypothetical protein
MFKNTSFSEMITGQKIEIKNLSLFILTLSIYTYFYISNIPNFIITIYKNPIFKLSCLLFILFYGNYDQKLTFYFAINYIYVGQLIYEQELLKNL